MQYTTELAVAWRKTYGPPPVDVVLIDCETSGFGKDDYVVQIAWLKQSEGRETGRGVTVFDWTRDLDRHGLDDLGRRLTATGEKMRSRGQTHGWSLDRLRAEGISPLAAFSLFTDVLADRPVLVGHNAWGFDVPFLDRLAYNLTRVPLGVPPTRLIDTNALVRAAQTGAVPRTGETYAAWAARANKSGGSKVRSNLSDFCVAAMRMRERHGADPTRAHDALYDCWLSGLVYSDFCTLITTGTPPWSAPSVPPWK